MCFRVVLFSEVCYAAGLLGFIGEKKKKKKKKKGMVIISASFIVYMIRFALNGCKSESESEIE